MDRYDNCFVCGTKNPIGLKLEFDYEEKQAVSNFNLSNLYEGYDDIIHGGIVAAILDEAMAKIILHHNLKAVTSTLAIAYKKPLKPAMEYRVTGSIINIRRKIIETESEISSEGVIYAEAKAKFYIIS